MAIEKFKHILSWTSFASLFSLASVLKFITTCDIYTEYILSIYRSQVHNSPAGNPAGLLFVLVYNAYLFRIARVRGPTTPSPFKPLAS